MSNQNNFVRHLPTLHQCDLMLVGGKAAALGEMVNAGFPVPPGFCLTTAAYRLFVAHNRLNDVIRESSGAQVQKAFMNGEIPKVLLGQIRAAYECLPTGGVAVRSSATAEDLPDASFAGQQDTYLNVRAEQALLDAIKACWGSLWTDRVEQYRARAGYAPEDVEMGVLVQAMVNADSAGVLFSANPVTGARDQIVINAAWGLGEAVVSGLVTPDTITVDKASLRAVDTQIACKMLMTVRTKAGVMEQPVPVENRAEPVLSEAQIAELATLGRAVEAHESHPMDIEWAFADGMLYLLQARPITALPEPLDKVDTNGFEWSREMLIERYPDPLTPYTASIMSKAFFQSFDRVFQLMGGKLSADDKLISIFFGRPYINASLLNTAGIGTSTKIETKAEVKKSKLGPLSFLRVMAVVLRTHRQWYRLQGPAEKLARQENAKHWDGANIQDLLDAMAQHERALIPLLNNHANSIIAAELTLKLLDWLTKNWLDDAKGALPPTLLAGLKGNMTVKTNHDLWALAVSIRGKPALCDYLNAGVGPDWRADIDALAGGPVFLQRLDRFLVTYGHRSPKYEFRHPCWAEDPRQILAMLRMYLNPSIQDPALGEARQAAMRAQAEEKARKILPLGKRWMFNRVLFLAQTYFRLRENQQFYLMMMLPTQQRTLRALGRHLVDAGWLEQADDIFFLSQNEGVQTARHLLSQPKNAGDVRKKAQGKVMQNKADLQRFAKMDAPVWLGRDADDTTHKGDLKGVAGSKGMARGRVRIVLNPDGFDQLLPGEILVTPATTPAWTPLFGIAAGLITDYGGLLSHSGVVAREYGLPAVLGVGHATKALKTGDMVEIDGTTGTIRKA